MAADGLTPINFESLYEPGLTTYLHILKLRETQKIYIVSISKVGEKDRDQIFTMADVNLDANCRWTSIFDLLFKARRLFSPTHESDMWCMVKKRCFRTAAYCHCNDGKLLNCNWNENFSCASSTHTHQIIFCTVSLEPPYKDMNIKLRNVNIVIGFASLVRLGHSTEPCLR